VKNKKKRIFINSYIFHIKSDWQIVYTVEFLERRIINVWSYKSFGDKKLWVQRLIWHLDTNFLRCTKILSQRHPFLFFLPSPFLPYKNTFMDDYDRI
jgi:hypothetical protein